MRPLAAACTVALALAALAVRAAETDVVVQAGHEGRPASCARFPGRACNLGAGRAADREAAWTASVADAAVAALRARGLRAVRRPADYDERDTARAFVAIHFDGSAPPCRSGASVGFPRESDAAYARGWESTYRAFFPFAWAGENISAGEREYYGYRGVDAPRKMLVELGEITCPAQAAWLRPRLRELGERLADYVAGTLDVQP